MGFNILLRHTISVKYASRMTSYIYLILRWPRHHARSMELSGPRRNVLLLLSRLVRKSEFLEEIFDPTTVGAVYSHGLPLRATGLDGTKLWISEDLALGWIPSGGVYTGNVSGLLRKGVRFEESRKRQEDNIGF